MFLQGLDTSNFDFCPTTVLSVDLLIDNSETTTGVRFVGRGYNLCTTEGGILLKPFSSARPGCTVGLEVGEFPPEFGIEGLVLLVTLCCYVSVWGENGNITLVVEGGSRLMLGGSGGGWPSPAGSHLIYFHVFGTDTAADVVSISNNRLLSSLWELANSLLNHFFYAVTTSRLCYAS